MENLKSLLGSNFSIALMSHTLPSWIRSKNERRLLIYFFATEITSLRFASINFFFAFSSHLLTLLVRSFSSSGVSRLILDSSLKYNLIVSEYALSLIV